MKDKTHRIISIVAENAFDKIQYPFMIKTTQQSGSRRNISQHNKSHIQETYCQHHIQWEKFKAFPLRSGRRQGCTLSPLLFNIVLKL